MPSDAVLTSVWCTLYLLQLFTGTQIELKSFCLDIGGLDGEKIISTHPPRTFWSQNHCQVPSTQVRFSSRIKRKTETEREIGRKRERETERNREKKINRC